MQKSWTPLVTPKPVSDLTKSRENKSKADSPRKRKAYISSKPLQHFLEEERMTHKAFAEAAGMAQTTISNYIRNDEMPRYVLIILEAFKKRIHRDNAKPCFYLISGEKKQIENLIPVFSSIGLTAQKIEV